MTSEFSTAEQTLIAAWERHLACEFVHPDPTATLATMSADPSVNHVPVMTGGRGREELLTFYAEHFLVQLGLLDPATLPVAGVETTRKVVDPSVPSNELMRRQAAAGRS